MWGLRFGWSEMTVVKRYTLHGLLLFVKFLANEDKNVVIPDITIRYI